MSILLDHAEVLSVKISIVIWNCKIIGEDIFFISDFFVRNEIKVYDIFFLHVYLLWTVNLSKSTLV